MWFKYINHHINVLLAMMQFRNNVLLSNNIPPPSSRSHVWFCYRVPGEAGRKAESEKQLIKIDHRVSLLINARRVERDSNLDTKGRYHLPLIWFWPWEEWNDLEEIQTRCGTFSTVLRSRTIWYWHESTECLVFNKSKTGEKSPKTNP